MESKPEKKKRRPPKIVLKLRSLGHQATNQLKTLVYQVSLLIRWVLGILFWGVNTIIVLLLKSSAILTSALRVFIELLSSFTASIVSSEKRKKLNKMLVYGGVHVGADEIISLTLVYAILFSIITGLASVILGLKAGLAVVIGLLTFIFVWAVLFMIINLLIYRRTESIENVLPDVLDLIAQNMVSGMTAYNSLLFAARPEFGPLAHELGSAAKKTLTGTPLEEALMDINDNVSSDKLERSITLIIQGMHSGGELPSVLQGVSMDMRAERNLKKQMAAETSGYSLFIVFTIIIGAPLLFSISLQFITVFTSLFEQTGLENLIEQQASVGVYGGSFMSISKLSIEPAFFLKYAVSTLVVICFFGSLLIGLIRTGKPISGIQNIPLMILVAVTLFFGFNYLMRGLFGRFLGF